MSFILIQVKYSEYLQKTPKITNKKKFKTFLLINELKRCLWKMLDPHGEDYKRICMTGDLDGIII